jgi:hypothetical protein
VQPPDSLNGHFDGTFSGDISAAQIDLQQDGATYDDFLVQLAQYPYQEGSQTGYPAPVLPMAAEFTEALRLSTLAFPRGSPPAHEIQQLCSLYTSFKDSTAAFASRKPELEIETTHSCPRLESPSQPGFSSNSNSAQGTALTTQDHTSDTQDVEKETDIEIGLDTNMLPVIESDHDDDVDKRIVKITAMDRCLEPVERFLRDPDYRIKKQRYRFQHHSTRYLHIAIEHYRLARAAPYTSPMSINPLYLVDMRSAANSTQCWMQGHLREIRVVLHKIHAARVKADQAGQVGNTSLTEDKYFQLKKMLHVLYGGKSTSQTPSPGRKPQEHGIKIPDDDHLESDREQTVLLVDFLRSRDTDHDPGILTRKRWLVFLRL